MDNDFGADPLDGVLGLAFQTVAVDGVKPLLNQAIDDELLSDPIFTIWFPFPFSLFLLSNSRLTNNDTEGTGEAAGRIMLGDIDSGNCGYFTVVGSV